MRLLAFVIMALLALSSAVSHASTFTALYSITGSSDGSNPDGGLTDVRGVLYGVTRSGGIAGQGVVYKVDPATGAEAVVYTFAGGADGAQPANTLINVGGVLFGTTFTGGTYDAGTVFRLDPATGVHSVVHTFGNASDGAYPTSALLKNGSLLYGVTEAGGTPGDGTVFTIDPASGAEAVFYAFQGGNDGSAPTDLIASGGTFYGTTSSGGPAGTGTVFRLDSASGAEAVIYALTAADGSAPTGVTVVGADLFVTVEYGGTSGAGSVLKVDPATGAASLVHDFSGANDGTSPIAALTKVGGTLYGSTSSGGTGNSGTIYKLNPATGKEVVLYAFAGFPDGSFPQFALIFLNGLLYGTTSDGGAYRQGYGGTAFALDPASGALTVLHSFSPEVLDNTDGDGLLSARGALYLTQVQGGPVNRGAIVKIDPASGAAQTLIGFMGANDGQRPGAAMIRVGRTLYGTTIRGGIPGKGTVFKFNPVTNAEAVLYAFQGGSDGWLPFSPLLFLKNALYGTTFVGGAYSDGTLFKIDPATGTETLLYSFDGANPSSGLIDVRGVLYGTTDGTIYTYDPATGRQTTLYTFTGGNDGGAAAGLVKLGTLLYGTTAYGGASQGGTVFSFNPQTAVLTVLHAFSGSDGAVPGDPLIAVNGVLYGTTQYGGGPANAGNVFKIDPASGAFTVLYNFGNGGDGGAPCSPLISVGALLYGGTCTGGAQNLGTVFALQP